jgi:hypothetical protein
MNKFLVRAGALAIIALATMAPGIGKALIHILNLTPYTIQFLVKVGDGEWVLESLEPEQDETYGERHSNDPVQIYILDHGDGAILLLETKTRWALTWDQEKSIVVVKKIEQ